MTALTFFAIATLLQAHGTASAQTPLRYDAPKEWVSKTPSSSMRLADFVLPKAEGDAEDATLTVYHFGSQGGGGVQANLDRWIGQMMQPDGRPSKDVAKASSMKSNELTLSLIDLPGTYVAERTPGSAERHNKPGFRLRAAVIEGKGGPYYVKLVGPAATVARWDASVQAFLKSLRVE